MEMNKIEINDIVQVSFNNSQFTLCAKAKVLYVPSTTGDSWRLKDLNNGNIHYVSEGCTITLIDKYLGVKGK